MADDEIEARAVTLELTGKWEELIKKCPWRVPNMSIPRCRVISDAQGLSDCSKRNCAVIHFMRGL